MLWVEIEKGRPRKRARESTQRTCRHPRRTMQHTVSAQYKVHETLRRLRSMDSQGQNQGNESPLYMDDDRDWYAPRDKEKASHEPTMDSVPSVDDCKRPCRAHPRHALARMVALTCAHTGFQSCSRRILDYVSALAEVFLIRTAAKLASLSSAPKSQRSQHPLVGLSSHSSIPRLMYLRPANDRQCATSNTNGRSGRTCRFYREAT